MHIEVSYLFDDDGWVLPMLTIDGELVDEAAEPMRISRSDRDGLLLAGLDPDEVERKWEER